MTLHQRVKELRLTKYLIQKELAQALGVNPATVNRWEAGVPFMGAA